MTFIYTNKETGPVRVLGLGLWVRFGYKEIQPELDPLPFLHYSTIK